MIAYPKESCSVILTWLGTNQAGIEQTVTETVEFISEDFCIGFPMTNKFSDGIIIEETGWIFFEDEEGIFGIPKTDVLSVTQIEHLESF